MRWEQKIQHASLTDVGFRRRANQDSHIVNLVDDFQTWKQHGHLFVVADGMGGHAVGDLASKIAVDTLPHTFLKSKDSDSSAALKLAIQVANEAINERGAHNRDFERMGTTCTAMVLGARGVTVGHVGDSRAYRVRGDRIDQLTSDHSLLWEMIERGAIKLEDADTFEAKNVITRSLGPEPDVNVDIEGPYPVLPGDIYVLCSDGLTGHLNDAEIGIIVRTLPPGKACRLLINLTNLRGGSDNITVIIARVGAIPAGVELIEEDDDEIQTDDSGRGAWFLASMWSIAILFVTGVVLALVGNGLGGAVMMGFSVVAGGLLLLWSLGESKKKSGEASAPQSIDDPAETLFWKPYRTASARMRPKFFQHLKAVIGELHQAANSESWSIDHARLKNALTVASSASAKRQDSQVLAAYADAIETLMVGLIDFRKQASQEKQAQTATSKKESE